MPTISATTRTARRHHVCSNCGKTITRHTRYIRAYGYAERGDRPLAIAVHVECADTETREKVRPTAASGDSEGGGRG